MSSSLALSITRGLVVVVGQREATAVDITETSVTGPRTANTLRAECMRKHNNKGAQMSKHKLVFNTKMPALQQRGGKKNNMPRLISESEVR